ncbi:hypothetical protein GN956_G5004 [Arapaima gigas]
MPPPPIAPSLRLLLSVSASFLLWRPHSAGSSARRLLDSPNRAAVKRVKRERSLPPSAPAACFAGPHIHAHASNSNISNE